MLHCPRCGTPSDGIKAYCANCGAPLSQGEPVPPCQDESYPSPSPGEEVRPPKGSRFAPLTVGGYIGSFLLLCIPLVNLILLIVWSCGGCKNQNKRNLARALLILYVICVLLAFIFLLILNYAVNGTEIVNELQFAALCRTL